MGVPRWGGMARSPYRGGRGRLARGLVACELDRSSLRSCPQPASLASPAAPSPPPTSPRVILGLDPGICSAAIEHRRSDMWGLSPFPNPFTGCPMQRIPGSSPRMTRGWVNAGEHAPPLSFRGLSPESIMMSVHAPSRKNFIPASTTSPILPSRTRAYGRKRNERLGGFGPGSLRVAAGKAQSGRMAGRGVVSTSYRGNPEGHRGNHLQR
ncbi:hypothetical protein SAMN05428936_103184 [Pelagibacterium halotolerans]|nr:hypothetical protein SAMN05428936_103184 [Pelagibacterium halotolerans]